MQEKFMVEIIQLTLFCLEYVAEMLLLLLRGCSIKLSYEKRHRVYLESSTEDFMVIKGKFIWITEDV